MAAAAIWAAVAATGCGSSVVWSSADHSLRVEESLVGQRLFVGDRASSHYAGIAITTIAPSPDGKRVAYGVRDARRWRVVTTARGGAEGKALAPTPPPGEGPLWDGVNEIVWSPASDAFMYAAAEGAKWRVVRADARGHVAGPAHDALARGSLLFSPNSRHAAHVAGDRGSWRVVVDGAPSPPCDAIESLGFAGDRAIYVGRRGDVAFVFDGVAERGPFEDVAELAPSATGTYVATVRSSGAWHAFAPQRSEGPFTRIGPIAWTAAGDRAAWSAAADGAERVFVGGVPGPAFDAVAPLPIVFDRTGAHVAFVAQRDGAWHVVVDGVRGPAFEGIDRPMFIGDTARVAYVARSANGARVVVDGAMGPPHVEAGGLTFTPAGDRFAFVARDGAGSAVIEGAITDGAPVERRAFRADILIEETLMFSPDGKTLGFLAGERRSRSLYLVAEGTATKTLDLKDILWSSPGATLDLGELRAWVAAQLSEAPAAPSAGGSP